MENKSLTKSLNEHKILLKESTQKCSTLEKKLKEYNSSFREGELEEKLKQLEVKLIVKTQRYETLMHKLEEKDVKIKTLINDHEQMMGSKFAEINLLKYKLHESKRHCEEYRVKYDEQSEINNRLNIENELIRSENNFMEGELLENVLLKLDEYMNFTVENFTNEIVELNFNEGVKHGINIQKLCWAYSANKLECGQITLLTFCTLQYLCMQISELAQTIKSMLRSHRLSVI